MTFKDFPHSSSTPSMLSPSQYKTYLEEFATKFELMKHIKLNTLVVNVRLIKNLEKDALLRINEQDIKRKFLIGKF